MNVYSFSAMTPDKKLFDGKIYSLMVPGADGYLEVLAHHAPLISSLIEGTVTFVDAGKRKETFTISGGVVEVTREGCVLLVDSVLEISAES